MNRAERRARCPLPNKKPDRCTGKEQHPASALSHPRKRKAHARPEKNDDQRTEKTLLKLPEEDDEHLQANDLTEKGNVGQVPGMSVEKMQNQRRSERHRSPLPGSQGIHQAPAPAEIAPRAGPAGRLPDGKPGRPSRLRRLPCWSSRKRKTPTIADPRRSGFRGTTEPSFTSTLQFGAGIKQGQKPLFPPQKDTTPRRIRLPSTPSKFVEGRLCHRREGAFSTNAIQTHTARIWETGFSCKSSSVACTRRSE